LKESRLAEQTEEEKSSRAVYRRPYLQNKERLVRNDLSVNLNVYLAINIIGRLGGAREDCCPQRFK
jgi:uncharacterized protein YnzC (UPF0291/DUF896 family)